MFYPSYIGPISAAPYVAILLAAFATCLLLLALVTLQDSDADTPITRFYQRIRLARTRLRQLLKQRGVQIPSYLRALGVAEIRTQIAKCGSCDEKALCDRVLNASGVRSGQLRFCPNTRAIDRYLAGSARPGGSAPRPTRARTSRRDRDQRAD